MFSPDSRPAAIVLICAFFLAGIALPVTAYVLKGEHVLQLMIEKNNLPKRLGIFQTVSFFDPEADSMAADYEEKVAYRIPGAFRSEIATHDFQRIHTAASGRTLTVVDGRMISTSEIWTDLYKNLFYYRDRKQLVENLQILGINFSVTSLGRYEGTICYVLGADYPDETVPQLWVAKDTFQPVRWIVKAETSSGPHKEILYRDWQAHSRSWYPSLIEFLEGGQVIQRISVRQVTLNPSISDELFNVERLEKSYAPRIPEENKEGVPSDISHQIEEFKKIYE